MMMMMMDPSFFTFLQILCDINFFFVGCLAKFFILKFFFLVARLIDIDWVLDNYDFFNDEKGWFFYFLKECVLIRERNGILNPWPSFLELCNSYMFERWIIHHQMKIFSFIFFCLKEIRHYNVCMVLCVILID